MKAKPTIAIVGPGALGSALALALHAASYRISAIAARASSRRQAQALARKVESSAIETKSAPFAADIIWLCVPDDAIAGCAQAFARSGDWRGRIVLHSSGARSSADLAPLHRRGAAVASLHPMMTFARGVMQSLAAVPFSVEGDAGAVRAASAIARGLGGHVFPIQTKDKPLYHAWGAFAAPFLLTCMMMAERVAIASGVPRDRVRSVMAPIVQQTVKNFLERGAAASLTGPLVRGDLQTIAAHLCVLPRVPGAYELYRSITRTAVAMLPVKHAKQVKRLLEENSAPSPVLRVRKGKVSP